MKNFRRKRFLGILIFLAVFAGAVAIVMLLWNALVPSIIGWGVISYWQAAGLMILCRLLLGGFGRFGKFGRWHHHGHKKEDFRHWHVLRDKMQGMTRDEKREFMRNHMRESHGFGRGFFGCDNKNKEDIKPEENL